MTDTQITRRGFLRFAAALTAVAAVEGIEALLPNPAQAYDNPKDKQFQAIQNQHGWLFDNAQTNYFLSDDRTFMKVAGSSVKANKPLEITDFITLKVDGDKKINTTPLMLNPTGKPNQISYLQFLTNFVALDKSQFNVVSGEYASLLIGIIEYDRLNSKGDEVGIQSLAPVMLYAGLNPHTSFFDTKYNQNPNGVNENIMMSYVSLQRRNEAKAREFITKLADTNATEEDFVLTGKMLNKLGKKQLRAELYEIAVKKHSESELLHKCLISAYSEIGK